GLFQVQGETDTQLPDAHNSYFFHKQSNRQLISIDSFSGSKIYSLNFSLAKPQSGLLRPQFCFILMIYSPEVPVEYQSILGLFTRKRIISMGSSNPDQPSL